MPQVARWREASERIDLHMFKVLEAGLEGGGFTG